MDWNALGQLLEYVEVEEIVEQDVAGETAVPVLQRLLVPWLQSPPVIVGTPTKLVLAWRDSGNYFVLRFHLLSVQRWGIRRTNLFSGPHGLFVVQGSELFGVTEQTWVGSSLSFYDRLALCHWVMKYQSDEGQQVFECVASKSIGYAHRSKGSELASLVSGFFDSSQTS